MRRRGKRRQEKRYLAWESEAAGEKEAEGEGEEGSKVKRGGREKEGEWDGGIKATCLGTYVLLPKVPHRGPAEEKCHFHLICLLGRHLTIGST